MALSQAEQFTINKKATTRNSEKVLTKLGGIYLNIECFFVLNHQKRDKGSRRRKRDIGTPDKVIEKGQLRPARMGGEDEEKTVVDTGAEHTDVLRQHAHGACSRRLNL